MRKRAPRWKVIWPVVALSLLCAGATGAQTFSAGEAVEKIGPGTINWTAGEVYAVGIGAPPTAAANPAQIRAMTERAAYVVAIRNLLETVKGVRVDSQTVVRNFLVQNDVIRTRVEGIVKGARIMKKRYLSDGSVEVLVVMPVKGAFLNAVVPETFGAELPQVKPAPPAEPRKEPLGQEPAKPVPPKPKAPEQGVEPVVPPAPPAPKVEPVIPPAPPAKQGEPSPRPTDDGGGASGLSTATGIVIDGRGLGLRPALLPRIVDAGGNEVYVGQVVTRTNAVEQGVAGYARDVSAASNNFRVTDNPAVIKALKAAGDSRTDLVIADADAGALRKLGQQGSVLQNCRVIIVY